MGVGMANRWIVDMAKQRVCHKLRTWLLRNEAEGTKDKLLEVEFAQAVRCRNDRRDLRLGCLVRQYCLVSVVRRTIPGDEYSTLHWKHESYHSLTK